MVSSPSNQALGRSCQLQKPRMMSNSTFSMRYSKLAAFFLAAGLLSGVPAQAKQCGQASWYGPGFYGNLTASGERLRPNTMTAAHPSLPFGSWVRVVNRDNGLVADVRISDRGPYIGGRIIDLAHGAAQRLGVSGLANVCISRL
jgi:rare lipoprotein A (peptidoglycan hydrolase)